MKTLKIFILLFILSCSRSTNIESNKTSGKTRISSNNIRFLNVYINNNDLFIKSQSIGDIKYFKTDITNLKKDKKIDDRVFANKILKLEEEKEEINFNNYQEIKIIPYEEWSKIIMPIIEKILINIIPKNKNEAIALSIANKYYVFFYGDFGVINFKSLKKIPDNLSIIKNYTEKDFHSIIEEEIKKHPEVIPELEDNFIIFETKTDDDVDSPYILYRVDNNTQYYFDYSKIFKTKQQASNTDYYIQLFFNILFKSHIIEPAKNPVTTIQKGSTFIFQNTMKSIRGRTIRNLKTIPPLNNNNEMMDLKKFEKDLDKLVGKKKTKGSLEFLIGGDAFFTNLLDEIEKTKNEIFIRLYIYSNDDFGVRISDILRQRDKNGVDVKVLFGNTASNVENMKDSDIPLSPDFKKPKNMAQYLTNNSNINVRTSPDTFFMFDHSKMIILDKKTAYVGGMNIGQPYRYSWHDMMVKLKGPVVYEVHNQFTQSWGASGPFGDLAKFSTFMKNLLPPNKKLKKEYDLDKEKQIDIRILYTKPQKKDIYYSQMQAIKNAKKRIYIQNPYLADYRIINALIEARGRGVDVRIIIPSKNNVGMMSASNIFMTNTFLQNGIRVYNYKGMTHVKAGIFDGWASIGSANFDNLSLAINEEFNIAFSDEYYVEKLKKELFDVDFAFSDEITELYKINWYHKVMSNFANRF